MSAAYDDEQLGVPQLPFDLKSHNMACALRHDTNEVTVSQSLCRILKNCWQYTSEWTTFPATDLMYPRRSFSDALLRASSPEVEQHLIDLEMPRLLVGPTLCCGVLSVDLAVVSGGVTNYVFKLV